MEQFTHIYVALSASKKPENAECLGRGTQFEWPSQGMTDYDLSLFTKPRKENGPTRKTFFKGLDSHE